MPNPPLTITNQTPTPLVADFNTLIDYLLKQNPVSLTKLNEVFRRKDLYNLNQQMKTHSIPNASPRIDQPSYPLLHLSLASRLFYKEPTDTQTLFQPDQQRVQMYKELTATEKYFFLLETLWVDSDWKKLQGKDLGRAPSPNIVSYVMEFIGEKHPGEKIKVREHPEHPRVTEFGETVYDWEYFLIYFTFFGIWHFTQVIDENTTRRDFRAQSITPTAFGVTIAPILSEDREFILWNLPYRRKTFGEWKIMPGSPLPAEGMHTFYQENYRRPKEDIKTNTAEGAPFFLPFVPLFPKGELQNTLPRKRFQFVDGTYVFKVSLANDLWRRIKISADDTLLQLHNAIQTAYEFADDHLYSFFTDGEVWSDEYFSCPSDYRGPKVDEVRIGELELKEGQSMLYLFDYGDEWRFQVTLEEIRQEETKPSEPVIIEKQGESPPQYFY